MVTQVSVQYWNEGFTFRVFSVGFCVNKGYLLPVIKLVTDNLLFMKDLVNRFGKGEREGKREGERERGRERRKGGREGVERGGEGEAREGEGG